MNLMLGTNTLIDFLSQELVIVGICLAAVGVAFALLAKRIAKVVRKSSEIQPTDTVMLGFKAFGLVCIVVALLLIIFAIN